MLCQALLSLIVGLTLSTSYCTQVLDRMYRTLIIEHCRTSLERTPPRPRAKPCPIDRQLTPHVVRLLHLRLFGLRSQGRSGPSCEVLSESAKTELLNLLIPINVQPIVSVPLRISDVPSTCLQWFALLTWTPQFAFRICTDLHYRATCKANMCQTRKRKLQGASTAGNWIPHSRSGCK